MAPIQYCFLTKIFKSVSAISEHRIVSKPQIMSRLRHVNIVERPDETDEEKAYRSQYELVQDWNNKYWAKNNELFNRCKSEYIKTNFEGLSEEQALSHDQLASFYREFLEQNRDKHVRYNKTWYKNHMDLLKSSLVAKISRIKINLAKLGEIKHMRGS